MIKTHTFCDICEQEITGRREDWTTLMLQSQIKYGHEPWHRRYLTVDLHAQANDHVDMGVNPNICKYCVIDAINKHDDRPKPDCGGGCAAHD